MMLNVRAPEQNLGDLKAQIACLMTGGTRPVQSPLYHHEATRLSMACVYAIDAYGPDAAALPRIVEDAFDEVDRIDRLMSHYKPDSPLSRLNRDASARAVPVEPELFEQLLHERS